MTDSDPSDTPEWPEVGIDTDTDEDITIASVNTDGACVPVEALQELIAEWQDKADTLYEIHEDTEGVDTLKEVAQCELLADELQALIDDYSNG